MSAKFYTLLTEIGAAKLASAAALGVPLKITHMAVGDGGGVLPTPSAQQTALVAEKRRAALNMLYIDPQNSSQIIAEQVIPETEGGWWIREVGLFDETGALIAVGNCPESYKPQLTEGSGRTQTVRMVLITSSTDNITLKIDPAVVLATRKYVDDKALELKVYVDDLMAKHLAAPDPHSQYAQKDSPTLTGIPKVPTPAAGNSTKQIANTEFVASSIAAIVDSAPAALDTLNELAAALGNDPNFATTMINALAGKQPLDNTLTNLSGKDVAALLQYLGLGEATETLNALRFCGALVSRGRKAVNPVRIFFGADSLSEGTPDSYTQIVGGMMGAKTAQSGLLVPCRKSLVSNVSGFLEGRDAGTRGVYPRTYSLSGDALYGDALVNATMRHLPMVTSGVQMAWKKARLYYLAQPGGGTFDFRQYSASGTKGDIVSVDTHSDVYQIQYAEIAINPGVSQAYTEVLNGNGKLCLFLLEYINSDNDYVVFNGAQGGASAQDWNRLNKETQRQWMSLLRFDTCIYNAGTNDRYSRTADDFRQDLSGYLTNIASADNAPHIIVVVPTQTKDYASTHAKDYPDVYSSVAEDNGFGFISMPLCLGDYATCSKRFGMLADGIHPSRAAHRAFGFFFASLLNMSVKNEPRPAFSAGGGSSDADPYEVDFSRWRSNGALVKGGVRTLIATFQPGAPYIHVYLDIEVAARVNPGVFSFIERRMRIHMRSGGSSGNITQAQVLLNEEKTRLIESGWGFTFSTDADTSTGTLQIFMEVSRDCNIFSRVTDVRVLVGSVAAKGSALKMVSML